MTNVQTIAPARYNAALAAAIKESGDFEKPEWISFVKSGSHKIRPVNDEDFWYVRAASILRQIYVHKLVGVQRLRSRYGGRKNRGMKPSRFTKSGGKIIRTILQQAEAAGLIEKAKVGKRHGRQLTHKGKEFLESMK